jgi:tetratricopeptide (TPR) repeat protein
VGHLCHLGGMGLFANGAPRRIGISDLNHSEIISAGLANMYTTIPSEALIAPVAAHLEDAARLLRESVPANLQPRLHTIIGDLGVFLGYLSFNTNRPAQAGAYLRWAKDHAREASDKELLTRVLVASGCVQSNIPSGQRTPSRDALKLLQEADDLAKHTSPRLQALVTAHLTEEQAAAENSYGSDEAFARSTEALAIAEPAEPVRHHPCAGADYHSLSNGEGLDGYRGVSEVLLERSDQATETLTTALERTQAPRRQVVILTDLGEALSQQGEPDESCARLGQAHTICKDHHFPLGVQRIFGVRERFPKHFAGLACAGVG